MKLQSIKIEGYRSLKSVEWKPADLNVLIGANATGKSNFLRVLELLPATADGELEDIVLGGGGMVPLLWNGQASVIALEVAFAEAESKFQYDLRLQQLGKTGSYEIRTEHFTDSHSTFDLNVYPQGKSKQETGLSLRVPHPRADLGAVRDYFASWSIHHDFRTDQRSEVRQSAVTRHEIRLQAGGQNLVPVLHTLYTGNRDFEEQIDGAMAAAFPNDYEKLAFPAVPEHGRISLAVRWRGIKRQPTAADLSDGTLRFLMLIAILANPTPAPLIAIDEPETGLHPGMLPIVAELAETAATRSQVILSTHSPELLDAFTEPPATTVFGWEDDHTVLRTLSGNELKRWLEDYSLGKFSFSGEAEALL